MTSPENPRRTITFGYGQQNDLWPFTLVAGAESFLRVADNAVRALTPVEPDGQDYLTLLFLLAHSMELSMKAFLRLLARSEEGLLALDHNLPAIFDAAVRDGFPRGDPCDRKLLNLLDLTYGNRKLLYPRAGAITVPFLRPARDLAVEYLRIARGGRGQWPDDHASDYGTPTLAELRKNSRGTDLRQLGAKWVESEEAQPPSLRRHAGDAPGGEARGAAVKE